MHQLGPHTRRIFESLAERIRSGQLEPGSQLPAHKQLAAEFGVAPMTIRQVLAHLEDDGLVSREIGRGTFVRAASANSVLVLAPSPLLETLVEQVRSTSRAVAATTRPDQALAALTSNRDMALVLVALQGRPAVDFVRAVRRRWPRVAVAAVVGSAADLAPLQDTPECPVFVLLSPPRLDLVQEVVRLAFSTARSRTGGQQGEPSAIGLAGLGSLMDAAGLQALRFQAQLLDSVDQAIVATGPSGQILYWNKGAERLYGWAAHEAIGRNAGELIVSPGQLAAGIEIMDRLRRGHVWTGEFPVRRRDNTEVPVLVTDSPIRDADGNLIGIIGVALDISDRKQAERDRVERARLEAALRVAQSELQNVTGQQPN